MKKSIKKRLGAAVLTAVLVMAQAVTAFAADTTKNSAETAFVRAKLTLVNEEGLSDISEDMLTFSTDSKWSKSDDGYYYYEDPLEDGTEVVFITGVHIPEEWVKSDADKKFRIVVTAEAAENMDGTANWADGTVTTSTSSVEYQTRKLGTRIYETTDLDVEITEYELDADGNRVAYQNDKYVLPGEDVDKIVVITVHINADKSTSSSSSHSSRDYDDDDDDDDDSIRRSYNSTEVIPLGGNNGNNVIPIDNGNGPGNPGIPSIFTGDNSMMIPLAAVAVVAIVLIVVLVPKKKKDKDSKDE
ncbi:MAG: hypothetical protein LUE86_10185 [Clostridiales bacterium]|nr:hypothetical protein [Clostridiales bacterium]